MNLSARPAGTIEKLLQTLSESAHAPLSRITPQFSGRTLPHVPWQFIHHGPLQLLVMRWHEPCPALPHTCILQRWPPTFSSPPERYSSGEAGSDE
jgi:hypothetical protein